MFSLKVLVIAVLWTPLICFTSAQKPFVDNAANILQTLKSSGMLEKFEDDLKQMLFDEKDRQSNNFVETSKFDAFDFIKSYAQEKNIQLHEKVLFYLMELDTGFSIDSKFDSFKWLQFLNFIGSWSERRSVCLQNNLRAGSHW